MGFETVNDGHGNEAQKQCHKFWPNAININIQGEPTNAIKRDFNLKYYCRPNLEKDSALLELTRKLVDEIEDLVKDCHRVFLSVHVRHDLE